MGNAAPPERRRRMVLSAKTRSRAAAAAAATVMLGSGTFDDGDPLLQATAAHPIPKGAGAGAVTMAVPPAVGGGWVSMEPGARQLTTTAARATRSQRHFGATIQG